MINGYGFFFELGRSRSPSFTNLYVFELTEIKHPKEEKVSNGNFFSNSFVYGKINNFYYLKLGFGQQRFVQPHAGAFEGQPLAQLVDQHFRADAHQLVQRALEHALGRAG